MYNLVIVVISAVAILAFIGILYVYAKHTIIKVIKRKREKL